MPPNSQPETEKEGATGGDKGKEVNVGAQAGQFPDRLATKIVNRRLKELNEKEAKFKAEYSFKFLSKVAKVDPRIIIVQFGNITDPMQFTEQVGAFQKSICEAFVLAKERDPLIQIPKLKDKMFGPQTLAAYKFVLQRGLAPGGNVLNIPIQSLPREISGQQKEVAQDYQPPNLSVDMAHSMNDVRLVKLAKPVQMPDGTGLIAGVELSIKPLANGQEALVTIVTEGHAAGPWTILSQQAQELFVTYDKKGEKVVEDVGFYRTPSVVALAPERRGARVYIKVNVAKAGEVAKFQPMPLTEDQCKTVAILGQTQDPSGKEGTLYLIRTEEGLEGWVAQRNLISSTRTVKKQGESPQDAVVRARRQSA
ncbi:MAG: hypothetical protein AAB606_01105 [Patescibacteria group bacterium]